MRIVAGKLRHRTIQMTGLDTTRETQDKVRQAIFNMIGPYFDGGIALDLFAGSGAMGLEAYSRGMDKIYLNDLNPKAIAVCKKNCEALGITNAHLTTMDYESFLKNNQVKMDLIILDPPYAMNHIQQILEQTLPSLSKTGIIVFEMGIDSIFPEAFKDLELIKNKTYGIKRVVVYRRCTYESEGEI